MTDFKVRLTNNIEGIVFTDGYYGDNMTVVHTYEVDISAELNNNNTTDTISSVVISGVPTDATLSTKSTVYTLTNNLDGTWTVNLPDGVIDTIDYDTITMTVPNGKDDFDLTITAIANDNITAIDTIENIEVIDVKNLSDDTIVDSTTDDTTVTYDNLDSSLTLTDADDNVTINGNMNGSINLGDGNNTLLVNNNSQQIVAGSGNDTIEVNGVMNGSISTGGGNDSVEVNGDINNSIDLGEGNDILTLGNFNINNPTIDGGDGEDTVVLEDGVTLDFTKLDNIETIDLSQNSTDDTLNITLDDVLAITDDDNTITITGDDNDTTNIDTEGWIQTSNTENVPNEDGTFTYEYSKEGSSSITLTVDEQIDTTGM